jgi:hypothetical protein
MDRHWCLAEHITPQAILTQCSILGTENLPARYIRPGCGCTILTLLFRTAFDFPTTLCTGSNNRQGKALLLPVPVQPAQQSNDQDGHHYRDSDAQQGSEQEKNKSIYLHKLITSNRQVAGVTPDDLANGQ